MIEKSTQVGASWRNHYQRLHLHTVKALSALPGLPFPDEAPRYVPRQGVVDYLAAYAAHAGIEPCFGEEATAIVRDAAGAGERRRVRAVTFRSRRRRRHTGANNHPVRAEDRRRGALRPAGASLHSRDYRDAAPFAGERVLVVGMGNTGAEIALDLAEHGVAVALSVRSPVNIVQRDVLGRPTQQTLDPAGAPAERRSATRWRACSATSRSATSAATGCRARASRRCASCASRAGRR